jgi:anti-sigma regulatory factor (Ser/Thr protein kinase)
MELDENSKKAVRELGEAINSAIAGSERVAWAIDALRELGYEPNLSLKLEIGLFELPENAIDAEESDLALELTEDDLRTLRRMNISLE